MRPRSTHGCGPLQVTPASGKQSCKSMTEPVVGIQAGWRVWQLKFARAKGSMRKAFEFYNGHPRNRERYGRKGQKMHAHVLLMCAKDGD
jgi:hypothetical protein